MPVTIEDVSITHELARRFSPRPDYLREKLAFQELAQAMAGTPDEMLPRLVSVAMDICSASSAGASVLEGSLFRWVGLAGKLASFNGANTPRELSPCGVCLDTGKAILMDRPERIYGWIAAANISIPEVLLVPLSAGGQEPIGTLWVVADKREHFNNEHARVLTELAAFTSVALRLVQSEDKLKQAFDEQETLAREMSHRVRNLLTVTDALVHMASRGTRTKEEMTAALSSRIRALADAHGLVRQSFSSKLIPRQVALRQLITAILQPYGQPRLAGPEVLIGYHAMNSIALMLHELATNAAKYGSLSVDTGFVAVMWWTDDCSLHLKWKEENGPAVQPPIATGFGSTLVERTISSFGASIEYDWSAKGLEVHINVPLDRVTA